jgi:MoxR-like ATPase
MQERIVTIDRENLPLPADFTVFATQNPVESEGTYPLPEAQKDRFLMRITMEAPDRDGEVSLATRTLAGDSPEAVLASGEIQPVLEPGALAAARAGLTGVLVRPELIEYCVDLVRATRAHEGILTGAGPRATQALVLAARAHAVVNGEDFVSPDGIRDIAESVLAHRLILKPEYEIEGATAAQIVSEILNQVAVPR